MKGALKDILKYFPSHVTAAIVGFISIPIITHLFTPVEYGYYILVMSTVNILLTIMSWLGMSIIRFYPIYESTEKEDVFTSTVVTYLLISVFGISIVCLIAVYLMQNHIIEKLYKLLLIGVLIFLLSSLFQTLLNFLRIKRILLWFNIFTIWKSLTGIVFGLILVVCLKLGIEGLLTGLIISIGMILPFVWRKTFRKYNFNIKESKSLILKMIKYSLPLVIGNLGFWILSLTDRYLIQYYRGTYEVGIYSASYAIGEKSILFIVSLFLIGSGPISIHIWEKEGEDKSKEFMNKLTKIFLIIGLPATIGLSVISKLAVGFLTSKEFSEGYIILPFIVFSIFVLGLSQRFSFGLSFYKKTTYIMQSLIIAGFLNLVLNIIFIPEYGYIAAAITTLIGYIVMLVLEIYFSRKFYIWKFPFITLAKCGLASIIMGIIVYYFNIKINLKIKSEIILSIVIGIIIYIVLITIFKEINIREIKNIFVKYKK